MFDDPDDDGDGVECLIVETRPDDDGQQMLPPRPAPGKDIAVTIKVKRGYVTGLIGDLCNSNIGFSLQFSFGETGESFTHIDDDHKTSIEPATRTRPIGDRNYWKRPVSTKEKVLSA